MTKLVVLDRDGVLNVDTSYVGTRDRWEWQPGAIEGLQLLKRLGYATAIATNQSGVGRGLYTVADFTRLHTQLYVEVLQTAGDCWPYVIAACFHTDAQQCNCRKPATGMWDSVILPAFPDVDIANSWMVGDRQTDIVFGQRIGLRTAKLPEQFQTLLAFAKFLEVVNGSTD